MWQALGSFLGLAFREGCVVAHTGPRCSYRTYADVFNTQAPEPITRDAHEGCCECKENFLPCGHGGESAALDLRRRPWRRDLFSRQIVADPQEGGLTWCCLMCSGNNSFGLLVACCHKRWRGGAETFAGDKRRFRQSPFVAYSPSLATKATRGRHLSTFVGRELALSAGSSSRQLLQGPCWL
jgi:hypothetical protein